VVSPAMSPPVVSPAMSPPVVSPAGTTCGDEVLQALDCVPDCIPNCSSLPADERQQCLIECGAQTAGVEADLMNPFGTCAECLQMDMGFCVSTACAAACNSLLWNATRCFDCWRDGACGDVLSSGSCRDRAGQ